MLTRPQHACNMVSGRHGVAGIQQAVAKRSSVEVARFSA
jgi:hypothetical protein